MAKITTSAFVANVSGSLGGSCFKRNKGGLFIMNRTTPRKSKTHNQQRMRSAISELSGQWHSLSPTTRSIWDRYASLVNSNMTGFNAFIGLNANLSKAQHVNLIPIFTPPHYPNTPRSITRFRGLTISVTENRLFWEIDDVPAEYVSVYYSPQSGVSQSGKESWRLVGTVPSSTKEISHIHDYPSGFVFSYFAFSIDLFGRLSPKTAVVSSPFFGLVTDPGRYGYSAYGFCYYGE